MSRGPEGGGSWKRDGRLHPGRRADDGGGTRAVCSWILGVVVRRGLFPSLGPREKCFLTVSQPSKALHALKRQSLSDGRVGLVYRRVLGRPLCAR